MTAAAQECRASANVPVPAEPADDRNLYCVLPEGHDGEHYDDGAEVWWLHRSERPYDVCLVCGKPFESWQRRTESDAGAGPLHGGDCNPDAGRRERLRLFGGAS